MKASYNWLRELVPQLAATPKDLAARLTAVGLEVEGIHEYGAATDACVVARVVAVRPHPTKSPPTPPRSRARSCRRRIPRCATPSST
jgi:hypothetical protein